jgi:hypothetical protein
MKRPLGPWTASLLLSSLLGISTLEAHPGTDVARFSPAEAQAMVLLRTLRDPKAPGPEFVGPELHGLGAGVLDQLLFTLENCQVAHPTDKDGESQILSEPQRDAVLGALGLFDRAEVLPLWERHFQQPSDDGSGQAPLTVAAVQVLGGFGTAQDLDRLWQLVLEEEKVNKKLSKPIYASLERATASILERDHTGFHRLEVAWSSLPKSWVDELVRAVGRTRNSLGNGIMADVLAIVPEQNRLVASQVCLLGPSNEVDVDARLSYHLLNMLDSDSKGDLQAASLAIGSLEDQSAIPVLIQLLEDERPGVVQNAHHALQSLTNKYLTGNAKLWERWYKTEVEWTRSEKSRALALLRTQQEHLVMEGLREISIHRLNRHDLALDVAPLLLSPIESVRAMAARTIADLGSRWAARDLALSLDDSSESVRMAAHAALVSITGSDLGPMPEDWEEMGFPHRFY